jgi:hypothetical protein
MVKVYRVCSDIAESAMSDEKSVIRCDSEENGGLCARIFNFLRTMQRNPLQKALIFAFMRCME